MITEYNQQEYEETIILNGTCCNDLYGLRSECATAWESIPG